MTRLQDELDLALELADEADRISLAHFRSERLLIETKPDMTPVSEADRQVEQAIRNHLSHARPDHAVLGEEFGGVSSAAVRWVVDPIDGTKRYIRGVPLFATLIALEEEGELTLGVVSAPALGRRWWAARGLGAFADGRPIRVSAVQHLVDAHVSLASLDNWIGQGLFDQVGRIAGTAWTSTGYGDFWSHMLVAEGDRRGSWRPVHRLLGRVNRRRWLGAHSSNAGPIHAELLALLA